MPLLGQVGVMQVGQQWGSSKGTLAGAVHPGGQGAGRVLRSHVWSCY